MSSPIPGSKKMPRMPRWRDEVTLPVEPPHGDPRRGKPIKDKPYPMPGPIKGKPIKGKPIMGPMPIKGKPKPPRANPGMPMPIKGKPKSPIVVPNPGMPKYSPIKFTKQVNKIYNTY